MVPMSGAPGGTWVALKLSPVADAVWGEGGHHNNEPGKEPAMRLKARPYLALAAAILAASLSLPSRADTLHTTGFIFTPADTYTVHRDSTAQSVYVGGFTGTFDGDPLFFWCFDLDHFFSFNNNYDYTETPMASSTQRTQLAQLFDEAYQAATDPLHGANADTSAAFQLAIWNIRYDHDSTVTPPGAPGNPTNHFWATNPGPSTSTARALADTWLQNLGNFSGAGWTIFNLDSTPDRYGNHHQNFITASFTSRDVPEPPALALALVALAGLVLTRRFKGERARGG